MKVGDKVQHYALGEGYILNLPGQMGDGKTLVIFLPDGGLQWVDANKLEVVT